MEIDRFVFSSRMMDNVKSLQQVANHLYEGEGREPGSTLFMKCFVR